MMDIWNIKPAKSDLKKRGKDVDTWSLPHRKSNFFCEKETLIPPFFHDTRVVQGCTNSTLTVTSTL